MATQFADDLLKKLGESEIVTLSQLIEIGLFGSRAAVLQALRKGHLSYVRVSPRRYVIPKGVVIQFIEENFHDNSRSSKRKDGD